MPGGPLLGVDWRWLAHAVRGRRRVAARPPRVVLLTPGGQEAYDVPVHRGADEPAEAREPTSGEQPAAPLFPPLRAATRWEQAYFAKLKLVAAATMLCLLWLRAVPLSVSMSAMLWPLYLFCFNAWRFPRKAPPRVSASPELFEEPTLSRLLSGWRTLMLAATVLLPLAFALAAPLVLGSIGGRAVVRVMAPPIFLLAAQLLMDSTIAGTPDLWVRTVAVLNPVGFNVLRLGPCWRCAAAMWAMSSGVDAPTVLERCFLSSGAALALANALLWTANLFIFLLPFKLPQLRDAAT